MQDEQIVALFFARSESAITETQKKYGKYCYYISFKILTDKQDAEECVNDTYLRAWNAIPPHKPSRLSTFLGKITRNLSLTRFQSRRAKKRSYDESGVTGVLSELRESVPSGNLSREISDDIALRDALNGFLRSLPQETRVIFMRRYWYMSSVKEIAKALSLTESKVKMTLMRTREKLKEYLEKEGVAV